MGIGAGLGDVEGIAEEVGGMSGGVGESCAAAGEGAEKARAGVSWRATIGALGGDPSMLSEEGREVSDAGDREAMGVKGKGNIDSSKRTSYRYRLRLV